MTRYIIRSENSWVLINATYKSSIKVFDSQYDAINYVKDLHKSKKVFIQTFGNKFWKINKRYFNKKNKFIDSDTKTIKIGKYKKIIIPLYVLRRMNEEKYFKKIVKRKLILKLVILFFITSILLAIIFILLIYFNFFSI